MSATDHPPDAALKMRSAQSEFIAGTARYGITAFVARRQFGKTTTFSALALLKMMKHAGHDLIFGSVKLNLGREIVRKEAAVIQRTIQALTRNVKDRLQIADGIANSVPDKLTEDDFANLYEAQRLEFRLYHSNSVYSRTKVVALTPDCVGETGDLMADEIGRVKNWRDVWEAIEPIASSNPNFRVTFSTTPPPDDTHYSFEQLAPPIGTEFKVNPKGNWYRTEQGIHVLRVDAFDAFVDGVLVYDLERREALAPEEHRRRHHDKEAWDRNYGVQFLVGGSAACGLVFLNNAQARGATHGTYECLFAQIDNDDDLNRALEFLGAKIGGGPVGVGHDVATTEKGVSNPSCLCVMEQHGAEFVERLSLIWKTCDPDVARRRIRKVLDVIAARKEGGRARRMCIDATNERYYCTDLRKQLSGVVPVELVIASETTEQPGGESITMKALLGNEYVAVLEDNKLSLPPQRYVKVDHRLVKRERGTFVCEAGPNGEHGDTFDGGKLALRALKGGGTHYFAAVI
jgi:hypothetical protein